MTNLPRANKTQHEGVEQIFAIVEPALALLLILEVVKPLARHFKGFGVVLKVQCRQVLIRLDSRAASERRYGWIERRVAASQRMVIAKGKQRPNFQRSGVEWPFATGVAHTVLGDDSVLPVHNAYALLQLQILDPVDKNREWIKAEFVQVDIPLRVDGTRILIARKVIAILADDKCFLEFGQQNKSIDRRPQRDGQQTVIAA